MYASAVSIHCSSDNGSRHSKLSLEIHRLFTTAAERKPDGNRLLSIRDMLALISTRKQVSGECWNDDSI